MAFDGKVLDVVATTDRARFAADLARHANEPYGVRGKSDECALARFYGEGFQPATAALKHGQISWAGKFAAKFDRLTHQPTGFDCLAILQSIP